ncbi:MAG TPA: ABC transporter [Ruminiclostridium sp.]|nr:ABC transporter [Ruminiclostridium sp.]
MKCMFGIYKMDEGEIIYEGKPVHIDNPLQALNLGIAMVHQELQPITERSVAENIYVGRYPTKKVLGAIPVIDHETMYRNTEALLEKVHMDFDPKQRLGSLSVSQMQLVEIAKALLFKCELIIMDEPTTALSTHEIENLFSIMRQLKEEGVSFIYISHKIPELFEICETYYVLRDGRLVAKGRLGDIDENGITELMIGRQLADDEFSRHVNSSREEVILSVRNLSGEGFKNISFELHAGEILAVTGLHGSGRDAVADALYGVIPYKGEILVNGKLMKAGSKIRAFLSRGIVMVPRMRKERGIHNDLSTYDNISMGYLNTKHKSLFIDKKAEHERFLRQKKALAIKTEQPQNPITSLSGGNQQKVILGRWLETDSTVILFDNPTQGIDVGTKFEIYHLILNFARQGKGIIIFSQEFPEIFKVADSCLVLYKGEINAALGRDELTEKNVMYYSTGANLEGEKYA